jgi:von Willebrand factor type A domain
MIACTLERNHPSGFTKMPNHIIVIFDHSGSMSQGFSGPPPSSTSRGGFATHLTKIEEAKAQLVSWLTTSNYNQVTIIPFGDAADAPYTFATTPADLSKLRDHLERIKAGGRTNLAAALKAGIPLGATATKGQFARYLIVTDGLSSTPSEDIGLVQSLPQDQGIDAIFIDPTPEGESHIRALCIRGRYTPVYGTAELRAALEDRAATYQMRTRLLEAISGLSEAASGLRYEISAFVETISVLDIPYEIRREAEELHHSLGTTVEAEREIRQMIADSKFAEARIIERLRDLERTVQGTRMFLARHSALVPTIAQPHKVPFRASLARPRRLAKGFSSHFLVQIFSHASQPRAKERISELFNDDEVQETTAATPSIVAGLLVDLHLSSPEVEFSDSVKKKLEHDGLHTLFLGKPKESTRPGQHCGLLSIRDATTKQEYETISFEVQIVDFAFDHVSRPLLARVTSAVMGAASIASFTLTFLGHLDKAFGLASGAAGLCVAGLLMRVFSQAYRDPTVIEAAKP